MTTDLVFCGRDAELAMLAECWQRAADVDDPRPQLVVLPAEPGVGKTRLALEFLARQVAAQPGDSAYWPADAKLADGRLRLNIPVEECRFDRPIPFLWWGIAAQAEGGDSVALHDRFLAPHLVAMSMRARMAGTGLSLAKIWGAAGADALASALQVDSVLSIGGAFLESVKLLHGEMGRGATQALTGDTLVKNRVDALLADLEQVLNPAARLGYARVPAIILIDDAQFAAADAGLLRFIERLTHAAMTQRWPVMILMTHWHAEWTLDAERGGRSVATLIHHARYGGSDEPGPISGAPGGYLNSENYREIRLAKLGDLDPALGAALPGLPVEQRRVLLGAVDGNPRFLEQVIAYLRCEPRLFDDFDPARAMTEEGLAEALSRSQRVHEVVLARLTAPHVAPEVREALALASVQGMRVVREVVEAAGQALLGHDLSEPLLRGQNPFSVMAFEADSKVGQFTERLFLQAAGQLRRNIKGLHDEDVVKAALMPGLAALLRDASAPTDSRDAAAAVALRLFNDISNADQRALIGWAATVHMTRLDEPEPIRETLQRFREALAGEREAAALDGLICALPDDALRYMVHKMIIYEHDAEAVRIADARIAAAGDERTIGGTAANDLAAWIKLRGDLEGMAGREDSALAYHDRAFAIYQRVLAEAPSHAALAGLNEILRRGAQMAARSGRHAEAAERIELLLMAYGWAAEQGVIDPDTARSGVGAVHDLNGHLLMQEGQTDAAAAAFDRAEAAARQRADAGDVNARRNLSAVLNSQADRISATDVDAALDRSDESVAIMRALVEETPRVHWLRDLAVALTIRGRVRQKRGEAGAEDMAEALDLLEQVAARVDAGLSREDVAAAVRNLIGAATIAARQFAAMGAGLMEQRDAAGAFAAYRSAVGALAKLLDRGLPQPALETLFQSAMSMLLLAPHVDPPLDVEAAEQVMLEGFMAAMTFLKREMPDGTDGIADAGEACANAYADTGMKKMFADLRALASRQREHLADRD